ncbi:MAG: aminopeptidase [Fluviicola sp.]|jgi:putative aminopeptidase FrvX|nr:aminopeptidase [Fluviicola sp.]
MKLLKELVEVRGASGDERGVRDFIINYVRKEQSKWKVQPQMIFGDEFQDTLMLVFGNPTTAIFAHMDSIGFTVGYGKNLIRIGGPKTSEGIQLVGSDSQGEIETELLVFEDEDGNRELQYVLDREIDRGTNLTFKPNFRETDEYVQSPYMDNRLGVWSALKVAESLENGIIVFSTYEEHGGNSVGFCGKYIYEKYGVRQALISDITWVTEGVPHGGGVAISMRDSGIPRKVYLNKIIELAKESGVKFQLEVESAGGSDGGVLQKSDLPFDWCFIGAPEDNVHSPEELVYKHDIMCMVELYKYLMKEL